MSATNGFVCKKCGGPSPVGIGFVADGTDAAARSADLTTCQCGYSQSPAAVPTFAKDTAFRMNGKVHRVWRNTRTSVHYMTEHGNGWEPTPHVSKRSTLESLTAAGLITAL